MRPWFASLATTVATLTLAAAPALAGPAIEKLSTHLYYHDSGAIDEREASGLQLFNAAIGGGDAKGASGAVVVQVTVTGAETLAKGAVELVAQTPKKKLLKQRVSLDDYVVEKGKSVVLPFLIYGTGCDKLTITSNLQDGRKVVEKRTVQLGFSCSD